MARKELTKIILYTGTLLLIFVLIFNRKTFEENSNNIGQVTIATVGCKDRAEELINLLKSVLLYNVDRTDIHFVIFTESHITPIVKKNLNHWTKNVNFQLTYEIHRTWFPKKDQKKLYRAFRPCSIQKLFIPVRRFYEFLQTKILIAKFSFPEIVAPHRLCYIHGQ